MTALGGYCDQVARLEAMRAEFPAAQTWYRRPFWYGAYRVGGWTWVTGRRNDLRNVLDALDQLAAVDARRIALGAKWPGWRIAAIAPALWLATQDGICVWGRSARDLDEAIGDFEDARLDGPGKPGVPS